MYLFGILSLLFVLQIQTGLLQCTIEDAEKIKYLVKMNLVADSLHRIKNLFPMCNQTRNSSHGCNEAKALEYLNVAINFTNDVLQQFIPSDPTPLPPIPPKKTNFSDCTELHAAGANVSGLYTVQLDFFNKSSLQVYCDMETDGGGWTVIQRRGPFLVQERFNRTWEEYKTGFGNLTRDFWIGNENILAFINQAKYKIRFDLEDRLGEKAYAAYNVFNIANEMSRYRLQIANYSGNAGDGMNYHDGKVFVTEEYADSNKCAQLKGGGWWYGYSKCFDVNVNGKYSRGALDRDCSACDHVSWVKWRNHDNLDRVEIKIKRR